MGMYKKILFGLLWCFCVSLSANAHATTLTVNVTGNGTVTGSGFDCPGGVCGRDFTLDTDTVALTVTPGQYYDFVDWNGNTAGITDPTAANINFQIGSADRTLTAQFALKEYNLHTAIDETVGCGGGSVTLDGTYNYNSGLLVNATPGTGCRFVEWQGDTGHLADVGSNSTQLVNPLDADTSLTAVFGYQDFTLTTTVNGSGSITGVNNPYHFDNTVSVEAVPDSGWGFDYWIDSGTTDNFNGSNSATASFQMGDAGRTIGAYFNKIEYTLTTSINEPVTCTGNTVSPSPSAPFVYDEMLPVTAMPATGCAFVDWTGPDVGLLDNPADSATHIKNPTYQNAAVTAHFINIEYPLNLTVVGTGSIGQAPVSGSGPGAGVYHYNDIVELTPTQGVNEEFLRWELNLSGAANPASYTIIDGTNEVRAVFGHTITATTSPNDDPATDNGSISPSGAVKVDAGADQTFTITPDSLYCVDEVRIDGAPQTPVPTSVLFENVNNNHTLSASFREIYTFTGYVEPSEARLIGRWKLVNETTGADITGWMKHGETINIPCGVTQVRVEYNAENCGSKTMAVNTVSPGAVQTPGPSLPHLEATGTYTVPTYELTLARAGTGSGTVSSAPSGGACTNDCPQTYTYTCNTTIDIRATAASDSTFDSWSGDVDDPNNSATTITLFSNQTVTAHFSNVVYQLSMGVNGSGTVTPAEGIHEYTQDTTVPLIATPAPGYSFSGWIGEVADISSQNTSIFMDADKVVTAVFVAAVEPDVDNDGDGFTDNDGDCNDFNNAIYPGAVDTCGDGIDQNCDGIDPKCTIDNDGDGFLEGPNDCNDNDSTIYLGAPEICGDGIDQDCSISDPPQPGDDAAGDLICTGDNLDSDGDGYSTNTGDCNDTDATIHPGAIDICNDGINQDCYDGDRTCDDADTCVTISDDPLNAKIQAAPPNIMFLIDDSGSMDWSVLSQNGDVYRSFLYIFDNPGDNRSRNNEKDVMNRSERGYYTSQWSGFNNMYYNPAAEYFTWADKDHAWDPASDGVWPAMPDADLDYPRSNPIEARYTLDFRTTGDVASAGDELVPFQTLWAPEGQRVEVSRTTESGGKYTMADAIRVIHEKAPTITTVVGSSDDAEQKSNGKVNTGSGNLDLVCNSYQGGAVGVRFASVPMPPDWDPVANPVTDARIVFTATVDDISASDIRVRGELAVNSSAFSKNDFNITGRAETSSHADWNNIPSWTAGEEYQTVNLSSIVNEIAGQSGWENGNAMTFLFHNNSTACRRAYSRDSSSRLAPRLVLKTATSETDAPDFIVDNGDDLFKWKGDWWYSKEPTAHNWRYFRTKRGNKAGDHEDTATWLLNIEKPGNYHVYTWVPDKSDYDDNARFRIYYAGGTRFVTAHMDQRSQTSGGHGTQWYELVVKTEAAQNQSAGTTSLQVDDFDITYDFAHENYSFTIAGDGTEYTLVESGTTSTELHFTPALHADVAEDTVITFKPWFNFTAPVRQRQVIHRAHYYTKDDSGNVYLVVLDTHDIDGNDEGEAIKYYRFNSIIHNGRVDYGELTQTVSPPDEVVPKKNYVSLAVSGAAGDSLLTTEEDLSSLPVGSSFTINEDATIYTVVAGTGGTSLAISPALTRNFAAGSTVHFNDPTITFARTYLEEKQNFVNWWSYFRRRELTAKAAVGRVIAEMKGANIGIHTINNRIKEDVLLVKPENWQTLQDGTGSLSCDAANNYCDNTDQLLSLLYDIDSLGGTPLRRGLERVGRYFDADDGQDGISGTSGSPYAGADVAGACQQSFAIAMTDGYYNGGAPNLDGDNDNATHMNTDGDNNTSYDGAPYGDNRSDMLADVAMYFYERDLSSALPDQVPTSGDDPNPHQHMVTYGVAFGVTGKLPGDSGTCPPACTWPTGNSRQNKIDDLYHATVNGRGAFFSAKDPGELVEALLAIKEDIEIKTGSGAAVGTTPSGQLSSDTFIFQGTYNPEYWSGDLKAYQLYSVEEEAAELAKPVAERNPAVIAGNIKYPYAWSAEETIAARRSNDADWWKTRSVITYNGENGIPFRFPSDPLLPQADELSLSQLALLGDNDGERSAMINYLRGDLTNEQPAGLSFRGRGGQILGDYIQSSPLMVETYVDIDGDGIDNDGDGSVDEIGEAEPLLFAGGNDGGLHVFNPDNDGEEVVFYIPGLVYSDANGQGHLKKLATQNPGYNHQYYVDGSPYAEQLGNLPTDPVLVVGGLNKGGKGIYLLNASEISKNASENNAASIVKWEYPNANLTAKNYNPLDADYLNASVPLSDNKGLMGYTYAQPYIVRSNADEDNNPATTEWMVAFGNGYESPSGNAALILLGINNDGDITWRREINTGYTGDPLAGQVTSITVSSPGTGYEVGDTVRLTSGANSTATAEVTSTYDRHDIGKITLGNGGSGYAVGDQVNLVGESGSNATIQVESVDAAGSILGWSFVNGGEGYPLAGSLTFSGGSGLGGAATVAGFGSHFMLLNQGSGYEKDDVLTASATSGLGTGASIKVDDVDDGTGAILSWTVLDYGSGYDYNDTITFTDNSGSTTGSGAEIKVYGGSISGLSIVDSGTNYGGVSTVQLTGSSRGTGASASIGVGDPAAECNGLSSTALIDVNYDGRVDYAFAGDLYGNMWKFDLRSSDPSNWQIAYCDGALGQDYDQDNPAQQYGCYEGHASVNPQPLITVQYNQLHGDTTDYWESTIQPITVQPEVIVPCATGQGGYIVLFGTGRYISDAELTDYSGNTIYGIWDWAESWRKSGADDTPFERYYGSISLPSVPESGLASTVYPSLIRKTSNTSTLPVSRLVPGSLPKVEVPGTGVTLLEQKQITGSVDSENVNTTVYRVVSNNRINWFAPGSTGNGTGEHIGWYFNLPGNGERVVTALGVYDGVLDITSAQPSPSPCSGGVASIIHGMDACRGGSPGKPYFDINGDGKINEKDMINIGSAENPLYVVPTGLHRQGMVYGADHISVGKSGTAVQNRSTSDASIVATRSRDERRGLVFWREINE